MRRFVCVNPFSDQALAFAQKYSPNIEVNSKESYVIFDLVGKQADCALTICQAEFNSGNHQSIGISDNLGTAILLANQRTGVSFSLREELGDLTNLPISALDVKPELLDLMNMWGICFLDEFCQLPEDELVARFGKEIITHLESAKANNFRSIKWNFGVDDYVWQKELEFDIELLEPLHFVLSKGVSEIFAKLDQVGLSTQHAELILSGRDYSKKYEIKIVFPNKKEKVWLKQIINKVEQAYPKHPINKINLSFIPCRPRTIQNDLFNSAVMEPENVELLVSKLKKIVELDKIGVPRLKNSWGSEFILKNELSSLFKNFSEQSLPKQEYLTTAFYYAPQEIMLKAQFMNSLPKVIWIKGNQKEIVKAGGPWRVKTEWHKDHLLQYDEWDIELSDGAVYRIYLSNGVLKLRGGYD